MKKFYMLLGAAAFLSAPSLTDAQTEQVPEANDEESRILYIDSEESLQQHARTSRADHERLAERFIIDHVETFGIENPKDELTVVDKTTDEYGMTHITYQQTMNGFPVEGHKLIVHFDANGTISSVNGNYHDGNVKTVQSISIDDREAIEIAKEHVGAPSDLEYEPSAELVIYPMGDEAVTVQKVNVNFMGEDPGNWFVFVDVASGDVVDAYNTIGHVAEDAGLDEEQVDVVAQPSPTLLETAVNVQALPEDIDRSDFGPMHGSGFGVHGDYRVLNLVYKISDIPQGTFKLFDWTRPDFDGIYTYDMKNQYQSSTFRLPGDPFTNNTAGFNSTYDAPGVDAHYNSTKVYEYFLEEHDRNSLDDEGAALISSANYGDNYNNAFWNGRQMAYGNGDGQQFIPLSAGLDVAAHEITHGVITNTAGLLYRFESGAVNESIADIFGVLVDTSSWDIGDNIIGEAWLNEGRTALRSLEEPGKFPVNANYVEYGDGSGVFPAHMDEFYDMPLNVDNGGVHVNSSIINHAAYLIGDEVGREALGNIVYRALTVYLTPISNFSDTRFAFIQSAIDIYGEGSDEVEATVDAFDGVGIYE
ncbi:M4 family metallopeptidase [Geomicrobium sp. JCM 19055]|uniref:M4 family metallopeptidase n=1 Tax=Geomicrobium sp. JCM 19055 TaxID=1460649 RepID=UPI00045ED610|nr:M4 family metallopeptidase [Geomicrobium sp. JCM 19055]GAJ98577.1 zinc metalloproteinase precursor [Geomicrobium sp. JCM 19055]